MSCTRGCCETQAEHFRSIQLGGFHSDTWKASKQFEKDSEAYRRLRRSGLQPPHVDGSASLEQRAESKLEVEMGKIFRGRKAQTSARIGQEISQELGLAKSA